MPNINWEYWSQDSIEPFMEAVIHFSSGNVTITDEYIAGLSFTASMFDSSHILFGPPEPLEGSLEIVDFNQIYNPTRNSLLVAGIQIDLYLGLWQPGFNQQVLVKQQYGQVFSKEWTYDSNTHTATIEFVDTIADLLLVDNRASSDVPSTDVKLETFIFDLLSLYGTISNDLWFTWGDFSAWQWNSLSATWGTLKEASDAAHTAAGTSTDIILPYSFYEDTQAATVNNGVEALCASLIADQFGDIHLFRLYWYNTHITLTDEDVETYEFMQSSIATYDSVEVKAQLPSRKMGVSLLSIENQVIKYPNRFSYTASRVYDTYAVCTESSGSAYPYAWTADVVSFLWRRSTAIYFNKFVVLGSVIELNEQLSESNIVGDRPYSLNTNGYIPSVSTADYIASYLESFIYQEYFTLKVELNGCFGFWPGGLLRVKSALYNIDAEYSIASIEFNYTGSIHTVLTLQRTA